MKPRGNFKLTVYLLGLGGTAIFAALLVREGAGDVMAAVAAAGWGLAAVTVFHIVPLVLDAAGWRVLFAKGARPRLKNLTWMRWMGESAGLRA